ncbi:hypothetical protein FOA52_007799 [Chlamydomonas sp. UWO 241]|nr:hypothetical protein FOA52_007799 [Chlamydomonas sp. UWO 241]
MQRYSLFGPRVPVGRKPSSEMVEVAGIDKTPFHEYLGGCISVAASPQRSSYWLWGGVKAAQQAGPVRKTEHAIKEHVPASSASQSTPEPDVEISVYAVPLFKDASSGQVQFAYIPVRDENEGDADCTPGLRPSHGGEPVSRASTSTVEGASGTEASHQAKAQHGWYARMAESTTKTWGSWGTMDKTTWCRWLYDVGQVMTEDVSADARLARGISARATKVTVYHPDCVPAETVHKQVTSIVASRSRSEMWRMVGFMVSIPFSVLLDHTVFLALPAPLTTGYSSYKTYMYYKGAQGSHRMKQLITEFEKPEGGKGDAKGGLHHASTAPCALPQMLGSPGGINCCGDASTQAAGGGAGSGSAAGVHHSSTTGHLLGSSFLSARFAFAGSGRASVPKAVGSASGSGSGTTTSGRRADGGSRGTTNAALAGVDEGADGGEGDCSAHSGLSFGAGSGDGSAHFGSGRGSASDGAGADDAGRHASVGLPLLASSFHSQDIQPLGTPPDDAGGDGGVGRGADDVSSSGAADRGGDGSAHGGSGGGGAAGGGLVYVAVPGLSQYVDVLMEAPGDTLPQEAALELCSELPERHRREVWRHLAELLRRHARKRAAAGAKARKAAAAKGGEAPDATELSVRSGCIGAAAK